MERLQDAGVKLSMQRISIMEYLLTHAVHPTAENVFCNLYPQIPTLSRTTVYNTLKLLADKGAVTAITIDDKMVRYDGDISIHAHFRCKRCGTVIDVPVSGLESVKNIGGEALRITDMQLYYYGYCPACDEKMKVIND